MYSVSDIQQTQYLSSDCVTLSYYECLEIALTNIDDCDRHGGLCDVYGLPHSLLPICNSTAAKECSKAVFWQTFGKNDQVCRGKKTCSMTRYSPVLISSQPATERVFSFTYAIESPQSSMGERLSEPYKVVHKEFLIWNTLTMIANIGGTLGLTLGFSFIGSVDWLTNFLVKMWSKFHGTNGLHKFKTSKKVSNQSP